MPASENALSGCDFNRPAATILAPRSLVQPAPRLVRAAHLPQRVYCRCRQSNCSRRQLPLRYSGDLLTKLAFGPVIRSCPLTRDVMFSCGFAGTGCAMQPRRTCP